MMPPSERWSVAALPLLPRSPQAPQRLAQAAKRVPTGGSGSRICRTLLFPITEGVGWPTAVPDGRDHRSLCSEGSERAAH